MVSLYSNYNIKSILCEKNSTLLFSFVDTFFCFLSQGIKDEFKKSCVFAAVHHERQPRNSATLRPENLSSLDSERILREAVGVFGYDNIILYTEEFRIKIFQL